MTETGSVTNVASAAGSPRALDPSSRTLLGFGGIDLGIALVLSVSVYIGLPARYAFIDVPAGLLAALLVVSGYGLLTRQPWGARVAQAAAVVTLVVGLLLFATLCFTASYLRGLYGPVGRGGAMIFSLVAALGLPYLVLAPIAQLWWLYGLTSAAPAPQKASR